LIVDGKLQADKLNDAVKDAKTAADTANNAVKDLIQVVPPPTLTPATKPLGQQSAAFFPENPVITVAPELPAAGPAPGVTPPPTRPNSDSAPGGEAPPLTVGSPSGLETQT